MTLTAKSTESLERVITDGMLALLDEIVAIRNRDKHPLLVAVSRRMPHVLFWFKHVHATEEQRKIMDNVEIITEIALPFIKFHNAFHKMEIVIIDDVIFSGRTLNYIINLTRDISGIDNPKVFVFFYYNGMENVFEWAEKYEIKTDYKYSRSEQKQIHDFIATIIAVTLPIDVSYPLFYIEEDVNYKVLGSKGFKDVNANELDNYKLEITYKTDLSIGNGKKLTAGDTKASYTSLLQSELSNSLNNDFAKIRVYDRLGKTVIMSYAPNILSDSSLRDRNLFECPQYKEIWNIALDTVSQDLFDTVSFFDEKALAHERCSNRTYRSLVSVANYLYSISSFNRVLNCNDNEFAKGLNYYVKEEDLSLIIGLDLAKKILPLLKFILKNHLVSPKAHRKLTVESVFIPEDYYTEYTVSKYTVIDDDSEKLDTNLRAIFLNARKKSSELLALTIDEMEYGVEGIMESFESLEKALIVKDYKRKVEINRWVDCKIDEGEIVSRYAYTHDFSGNKYWRRFFRKTSLDR